VIPATPADAKGLLTAAIRDPNPVIFLEQKYLYRRAKGEVPDGEWVVPLGTANVARAGTDATVVAWGSMVHMSLEAADALGGEGVSIEVVDLRTIVPWDKQAVLDSAVKTGRVLVVCEAHHTASFGAEVAATVAEEVFTDLDAPVARLSGLDTPVPAHPAMEAAYLPDAAKIARRLRDLVAF
jgi:pyruvate dehydrogenase E1 component beta subunit